MGLMSNAIALCREYDMIPENSFVPTILRDI